MDIAYRNEDGEYTAVEYHSDRPRDPEAYYEEYDYLYDALEEEGE